MNIYDIHVKDAAGNDVSMAEFEGKVLLIVNTATGCGFTPQYDGLQSLFEKYEDQGLVVLDFPCNQFGGQAPGTQEEIGSFCQANYGITFPQFAKIEVNGPGADPLYEYLKSQKGGLGGRDIKWNFTKFLVDRQGKVVDRFASTTTPEKVEAKIKRLL